MSTLRHLIEKDPVSCLHRHGPKEKLLTIVYMNYSTESPFVYSDHFADCLSYQGPIMDEQIEDSLFHMLDEETDSEYVKSYIRYILPFELMLQKINTSLNC